jgi:hypothetical protein
VLVWLLFVLVNLRPHYFSCSPGFGVWGSVYLLVVCIGCSTSTSNVDGPLDDREMKHFLRYENRMQYFIQAAWRDHLGDLKVDERIILTYI